MNREEAKKLLPIMQAFAEGKTIQKHFPFAEDDDWVEENDPDFNPQGYQWRIKPEPKYRPFEDADECWDEMLKHQPFGWVKNDNGFYLMDNIFDAGENEDGIYVAGIYQSCKRVYEDYTFADGTPFGIKEGGEE